MYKKASVLLLAAYIAGCGSTPPADNYYSLVLEAAAEGVAQANSDAEITVNLMRIDLPPFLQSRAMALQTGPNQVRAANHHFWAEPLEDAIAKTLARDLSKTATLLNIERNNRRDASCELRVEFDRFHTSDDGQVLASGRYWLDSANGEQRQEFDVSRRLANGGYANAVSALRDALNSLAEDIGSEIASGDICMAESSEN